MLIWGSHTVSLWLITPYPHSHYQWVRVFVQCPWHERRTKEGAKRVRQKKKYVHASRSWHVYSYLSPLQGPFLGFWHSSFIMWRGWGWGCGEYPSLHVYVHSQQGMATSVPLCESLILSPLLRCKPTWMMTLLHSPRSSALSQSARLSCNPITHTRTVQNSMKLADSVCRRSRKGGWY